jgi:DNA replication protein DnaC
MKKINLTDTPFFNQSTEQPKRPSKPQTPTPLNVAPPGMCCDGSGWFLYAVPHGHPLFSVLQKCECGRAGNPDHKVANLIKKLHSYAHCTFESWDESRKLENFQYLGMNMSADNQKKTLEIATRRALAYADNPQGWLYIHGSYGAGKTHLAAAIAKRLAQKNMTVEYTSGAELINELRNAAGKYYLPEVLEKYIKADVLFMDDMGVEELTSEFVHSQLWQIFDKRMEKLMIITSNLDLTELQAKVGGRIGSRLLQASKIYLPLSDFRKYRKKDIS